MTGTHDGRQDAKKLERSLFCCVSKPCFGKTTHNVFMCESNWVIIQIYKSCPWIRTALRLRLNIVLLTQKMNHGTCREPRSSEQLSQQAGGQIRPCFHWGGERDRERDIWKLSTECFLNGHFQNHGSKSTPCRENKLCYLTQEQSRAVIIKWLAQWVNSPAISSHSYAERSWLSLKWYLGSGIRNPPDWSRSRKLCLTWNRKSP